MSNPENHRPEMAKPSEELIQLFRVLIDSIVGDRPSKAIVNTPAGISVRLFRDADGEGGRSVTFMEVIGQSRIETSYLNLAGNVYSSIEVVPITEKNKFSAVDYDQKSDNELFDGIVASAAFEAITGVSIVTTGELQDVISQIRKVTMPEEG